MLDGTICACRVWSLLHFSKMMTFLPRQKEENVLAQEAVLDALLRSESQREQWMWDKENQTGGVCHF